MRGFRSGGRRALVAALLGAVLVAAGCGSTRSDKELAEAAGQISAGPAAAPTLEAPADTGTAASSDAAAVPAGDASSSVGATNAAPGSSSNVANPAGKTGSAATQTPSQAASRPASASAAPAAQAGSNAAPAGGATPAPGAGTPPPAAGTGTKAPIVLGSIGSDSGVLGQILFPVLAGAKAWAADVNARGGADGHPVKVIFADDGGDPGRALSLARRLVDQDGAMAFYAERGPGTAQAINGYLEQQKIPVIGGCGCSVSAAQSPMSFMVGVGGDEGHAWMLALALLTQSDKRKVSIIYCRESPTCKAGRDRIAGEIGQQAGLQVVHEAQVTITAPDYTAEALAAKNAGAEAVIGLMDTYSLPRFAKAAHRQNWKPEITMNWSGHDERFPGIGGPDVEGFLIGGGMPHWTSPKLNEFRAAMERHVQGGVLASWSEMAWGAGKLIEVIAKGLPAQPTSADFLKGLYAVNGETLGGLIPPLGYSEGQGSDRSNFCTVPMRIEGGKHIPKDGDNFTCAPGWQPVHK